MSLYLIFSLAVTLLSDCALPKSIDSSYQIQILERTPKISDPKVITGAERMSDYLPELKGKRVALVVNQTSMAGQSHLIDTLLRLGINIGLVFAPEHGFRGEADAGEHVRDGVDPKTGLPVISLYGKKKKPYQEDLKDIDLVVFDIQDVGVRFYTYLSTLHYIMEACAESDIPLIVLDRPNPHAHYTDGPVLDMAFSSFVGMHPVPVVYGMTIGEYAHMINGEGWLKGKMSCSLTVVECKNFQRSTYYELSVRPSPNLPDMRSILLYPSICFFEGTFLSLGRGTDYPFQWIGHPACKSAFSFVPKPNQGSKNPPLNGQKCFGLDLSREPVTKLRENKSIQLGFIIDFYNQMVSAGEAFFLDNLFFDKLAGTDDLRLQIASGMSENDIRATWQKDLDQFQKTREKYMLYKD